MAPEKEKYHIIHCLQACIPIYCGVRTSAEKVRKKVCTGPEMVPKVISGALSTSLLCLPEGLGSLLFFLPVLPHLVLPCMENFETQREMSTLRV